MPIRFIPVVITLLSLISYILGLCYPMIITKHQVFGIVLKHQEITLVDSVFIFYRSGEVLIASIIFLFTIILPSLKYIELFNRIFAFINIKSKILKIIQHADKWSMIDVFLVALLILNFKINSSIIVMKIGNGATFLALSVIFRMAAGQLTNKTTMEN